MRSSTQQCLFCIPPTWFCRALSCSHTLYRAGGCWCHRNIFSCASKTNRFVNLVSGMRHAEDLISISKCLILAEALNVCIHIPWNRAYHFIPHHAAWRCTMTRENAEVQRAGHLHGCLIALSFHLVCAVIPEEEIEKEFLGGLYTQMQHSSEAEAFGTCTT